MQMSRCGCRSDCNCVVAGGDCVEVTGSGLPAVPYVVSVVVDPDETNQLSCGVGGLYDPPASVEVDDTACIDLAGSGCPGDPILATPIIASLGMYYPDSVNLLECTEDGLQVVLHLEEGDCVALSGSGSESDPLRADLLVSSEEGNIAQCLEDGLFIPAAAAGAIDI